jgi:glycosyltransferase involved in cell wall biosynthesis
MSSLNQGAAAGRGRFTGNRRGSGGGRPIASASDELRLSESAWGEFVPLLETVSLVIPTKNEARNLFTVLEHVPRIVDEIIVVDGLSSDVTEAMAKLVNPAVRIVEQRKPGKGNALRAGFAAATGDLIVVMDADGSMSPSEIPHMLHFLANDFDFVKGSRFLVGGGSLDITPVRRAGNLALVSLANVLYHTQMTDLCYGFFAFRRLFLDFLDLQSTGFEVETEITARAILMDLRVTEVPSMELPRRSGVSNLHTFRDGYRVIRTLFAERARRDREVLEGQHLRAEGDASREPDDPGNAT